MASTQSLGDRLAAARRRTFVGRAAEREVFRAALGVDTPVALIYVHGPGGTGKTALLQEFARIVAERGDRCVTLDARDIEPSSDGFLAALGGALGTEGPRDPLALLRREAPAAILLDTFEDLGPLDAWLREEFLPALPAETVLVLARRRPPGPAWRADAGLSELSRVVPLRNLSPDEGRDYLARRGVPEAHHQAFLECTHGHPLALALFGDLAAQRDLPGRVDLGEHPDVVRALMARFVEAVPDAQYRAALEVCALARVTTESLLAEVLGVADAHDAFEWLRGLSFIEHSAEGIYPHDLARDVLEADLRWRDPDRHRDVHHLVRRHVARRFLDSRGRAQQRVGFDKLFLHKRSPLMRPYFDWAAMGSTYIEPATPEDHPAILDMLRQHEGEDSADIGARWLERQPGAFQVWRGGSGPPLGFMAHLLLGAPDPEDLEADPALGAIWPFIRRAGALRPGERFLVHRFWMGRETYQDTTSQSVIAAAASVLWLTVPDLAWSFPCTADAEHWRPMFAYCNFTREPDADFQVGDRRYGVFAHDWRREGPAAWLDTLADRDLDSSLTIEQLPEAPPPLLVLSEPEFRAAVRDLLRDYTRPAVLAGNPLARSRLALDAAGTPSVEVLRTAVREAVEALKATPRDEKLHRALWRTYIQPARTQEAAAEALHLPFNTYRYQLARGIDRVAATLWERELHG